MKSARRISERRLHTCLSIAFIIPFLTLFSPTACLCRRMGAERGMPRAAFCEVYAVQGRPFLVDLRRVVETPQRKGAVLLQHLFF